MSKRLLLTGADGFIGTRLARTFSQAGWEVHGLVRNASGKQLPPDLHVVHEYSLETGLSEDVMRLRADLILHAAFQTRTRSDPATNLHAAKQLSDKATRDGNCSFVFLSSMSAHDHAYSTYGRSKREIELALPADRALIIRPGFVIGPGGIFRRLAHTLARARVAPMPYGGALPIQAADVEELCRAVLQLSAKGTTGLFAFGEETPISIEAFYRSIAAWAGKPIRLFPVPGTPILLVAHALEKCRLRLPLTAENLLGLKGLIHQQVEPLIQHLGWRPSPTSEILKQYDPKVVLG